MRTHGSSARTGLTVYRDEPLDDEADLRVVVGDDVVEALADRAGPEGVAAAIDLLRLAQGWVDDDRIATWLTGAQQRLDGRSPLEAVGQGDADLAAEALRAWLAAQG